MQSAAKIIFNPDIKYHLSSRMWQGVPSIEKTGNRIWAAWFSGGKYEPCIHNYGVLAYSDDGGESFVEPYLAVTADESKYLRVMDLQLWREDSGRLWCWWAQDVYPETCTESDYDTDGNILFDAFFGDVQAFGIYTDNPEAESPTWSDPVHIGEGFIRNRPTPLPDGNIFVPGYHVKNKPYYRFLLTDDIAKGAKMMEGPLQIGSKNFDECMAIVQKDGSVRFLARTTTGYLAESYSLDNCKTWGETKQSTIENPCTRFFIRRLSNGMQLLINTPSNKPGNRKSLVAYLSDDEGASWKYSLVIDPRSGTTYPDAVESEDGFIYMIHDVQRDNRQMVDKEDNSRSDAAKEICLSRFTVADIMNGSPVTDGTYLARVISKVDFDKRSLGSVTEKY